jgi:dipeptidyl aminopeptidase/acylaminoacyl peptidase
MNMKVKLKPSLTSILIELISISVLAALSVRAQATLRILTPDELANQETVRDVAISPDHTMLAYMRWDRNKFSHANIWVVSVAAPSNPLNITQGERKSDFNYVNPTWSPDGSKLAMFSSDETGWHVAIWNKSANRLKELDSVRAGSLDSLSNLSWFDNDRLIIALQSPDSKRDDLTPLIAEPTFAYQGALQAKEGKISTGTVIDTGIQPDLFDYPQDRLALVAMDGKLQALASAVQIREVSVSPDKHYVAFLKQTGRRPLTDATTFNYDYQDLGWHGAAFGLEIVDLAGKKVSFGTADAQYIKPYSFHWGPDGKSFALVATVQGDPLKLHIFRGGIGQTLTEVKLGDNISPYTFNFDRTLQLANHSLLVQVKHVERDSKAANRLDWWEVPATGAARLVTRDMKEAPSRLSPIRGGRVLIGVADGDVWRFDVDKRDWADLTASFEPRISSFVQTYNGDEDGSPMIGIDGSTEWAVVSIRNGEVTDYYRLDTGSGLITPLPRPSPVARLVGYDGHADIGVFFAEEDSGTYLTLSHRSSNEQIVAVNEDLKQIVAGNAKPINYRGSDGQDLKGWLLLPPGYKDDKRYPLVTWVYAGDTYDGLPSAAKINGGGFRGLQLFAARGYAVLIPSMPLDSRGEAQDVYLELTKGVLPAVDKVIDLGIADPNRLAVGGWSYGGFSTFGLITQTNRFKAAIAGAGIVDFVSEWGTFTARHFGEPKRQRPPAVGLEIQEAGPGRMANPPWKDAGRYLRNSPILYADRVRTPVLIIHGDLDLAVPIQQSEEFLSAMFRLDKRARYIQYTGENHALTSPANIRDMWMQFYAWLDEFCDVSRDNIGHLVFDGDHVKSRNGDPPLKPEDFERFNDVELKSHPWLQKSEPGDQRSRSKPNNQ